MACDCKRSCDRGSCSCMNSGLKCTDACSCSQCENTLDIDESDVETDEDDYYDEEDDDLMI